MDERFKKERGKKRSGKGEREPLPKGSAVAVDATKNHDRLEGGKQ